MDVAAARELGPKLVTFLKVIFIGVFGVLAATTRDTTQIKKKGFGLLFAEAVVVGAGAALSFGAVGWNRRFEGSWPKLLGISFVVFFALHFLFELSGFNEISASASTGAKEFAGQTQKLEKSMAARVTFGLILFVLAMVSLCAWDSPWQEKTAPWRLGKSWWTFFGEALIIGLGSAVPTIMIVKDRGGERNEILKAFLIGLFMFGSGHFGLQYSGLYREFGFMPGSL